MQKNTVVWHYPLFRANPQDKLENEPMIMDSTDIINRKNYLLWLVVLYVQKKIQ